nr:MAG TPA: hypothetical protein [Caudoviricetes sp.]
MLCANRPRRRRGHEIPRQPPRTIQRQHTHPRHRTPPLLHHQTAAQRPQSPRRHRPSRTPTQSRRPATGGTRRPPPSLAPGMESPRMAG